MRRKSSEKWASTCYVFVSMKFQSQFLKLFSVHTQTIDISYTHMHMYTLYAKIHSHFIHVVQMRCVYCFWMLSRDWVGVTPISLMCCVWVLNCKVVLGFHSHFINWFTPIQNINVAHNIDQYLWNLTFLLIRPVLLFVCLFSNFSFLPFSSSFPLKRT